MQSSVRYALGNGKYKYSSLFLSKEEMRISSSLVCLVILVHIYVVCILYLKSLRHSKSRTYTYALDVYERDIVFGLSAVTIDRVITLKDRAAALSSKS